MAIRITAEVYEDVVRKLSDAEQNHELIADVWKILADAGDVYAANAYAIIAERNAPVSVFAQIVQAHWDRVAGPEARQSLFLVVGLQHVQQYVSLIDTTSYSLPNTEQIEASYRQAVIDNGLPALTAVDSMFSVLDYNIETSSDFPYPTIKSNGVEDITWARILDPELESARIRYDSKVFLNDNIEPIKEIILTALELPNNSLARTQLIALAFDAIGDVLPQFFGMEDPQALSLTAGLFVAADSTITDAKMLSLLDAAFLDKGVSSGTQQRDLGWLTKALYHAVHGTELTLTGGQDALYSAASELLDNLKISAANGGYRFVELTGMSAGDIAGKAQQGNNEGQAFRYALVNAQPFVLFAANGDAAPGAQKAVYSLDNFTEEYMNDRAAYVAALTKFYMDDKSITGPEAIEYHDMSSGSMVMVTATSGTTRRIVFGSDGNDLINHGGSEADHLYGGKGDDILEGKGGADYLEGGEGFDTYRAGDGDTIFDVDGQGRVLFGNQPLKGGRLQSDGSYQSDDGLLTYRLEDQVLTVTGPDGELTITNFSQGDLGIELGDAAQESDDTTHTIVGDLQWKDFDADEPGIQVRYDELGNKIYANPAVQAINQNDELYDSVGNDLITSGGGDDIIHAWRGGDDHIQAGDGQDKVYAGAGDDVIEGGADTDILSGEAGNDQLYADGKIGIAEFLASDTGYSDNALFRLVA